MDDNSSLVLPLLFENSTALATETLNQLPYQKLGEAVQLSMRCVGTLFCILGMWTNAMTMRTFLRIGLDDTVSISFFMLAVIDLANCIWGFVECVTQIGLVLESEWQVWFPFRLIFIYYYSSTTRIIFTTEATLIKMYLAIQRCLCVVLPFQVKSMFTLSRTYIFIGIGSLFSLIVSVMYTASYSLTPTVIGEANETIVLIEERPGFKVFVFFVTLGMGTIFNLATIVIVLTCLIFMITALNRSTRFRKSAVDGNVMSQENSRERQALVQVMVVSIIFMVTYFPYIAFGLPTLLIPGFHFHGYYHYLIMIVFQITTSADFFNSSTNFFIYYRFNTRFRARCFSLQTK